MSQLNLTVPSEFAESVREAARGNGCQPTHIVQAMARVVERYDLDAEIRAESIAIRDDGELRRSLGSSAGGRAKATAHPKL